MQQERNYRYAPTYSGCGTARNQNSGNRGTPDCRGNYPEEWGGCGGTREDMVLAMAYVLSQPFENLYTPAEGWRQGTIFCDLDLPYGGGRIC
ncbi:MAG: spore coat associated protein CotJA [Clostridia bacterium]|nr:spore coat associated protein CotJA [Clostridia bacterium]